MGLIDTIRSLLGLSGGDEDRRSGDGAVAVEHDPAGSETTADAETPDGSGKDEATAADAATPDGSAGGEASDAGTATSDGPVAADTDAAASTGSIVDETPDAPDEAAEPPEATAPTEDRVDPEAGGAVESDATLDGESEEPSVVEGTEDPPVDAAESDVEPAESDVEPAESDVEPATDGVEPQGGPAEDGPDGTAVEGAVEEAHEAAEAATDDFEASAESEAATDDLDDGETEAADDAGEADEGVATASVETVRGIGPAYASRLADTGVETVGDLAAADAAALAPAIEVAESRVDRWVDRANDRIGG